MAYIKPKKLKKPTKKEMIVIAKKVHKETTALLKKLDELKNIPARRDIYIGKRPLPAR